MHALKYVAGRLRVLACVGARILCRLHLPALFSCDQHVLAGQQQTDLHPELCQEIATAGIKDV